MQLNQVLYRHFETAAAASTIETISIGLGYTAVTTTEGGIGVAYTYFDSKQSCHFVPDFRNCEGRSGLDLLENIRSDKPLHRSVALAAINAFNHPAAIQLPEDKKNTALFDRLDIGPGKRIAMVGYFGPLIKKFKARRAVLEILDNSRSIGRKSDFFSLLNDWAEILFLTSTSILNNTCEDILARAGKQLTAVMLGPSTPMVAEAFEHLPVHLLAGTVPLEKAQVLKAVRHGQGTPVIQRFSRKVCLEMPRPERPEDPNDPVAS